MLSLENLNKTFHPGTPNERVALRGINLTLAPGDFVTVIGGNGAGKSTLMNAVAGVFLADAGRITLDGADITFLAEHKRARFIGRLFQDPMKGTAPNMTLAENLALAYKQAGDRRFRIGIGKKLRTFFQEQLAQLDLGLEDRLGTKLGLFSGGQRQAVTLLMATICTPKLLLLDEHTAALDPATAEKVLNLTRTLIERDNITTIMVTHNMANALEMGNRTLMMHDGAVSMDVRGEERQRLDAAALTARFG